MPLITALIKTLTFRKVIGLLKVQLAYIIVRWFGVDVNTGSKPFLSLEASSICNLSCPECTTGCGELSRTKGFLSLEDFKAIIDQTHKDTIVLNLYMQGEPYLNTALPEMIHYAKAKNIFVSLSTNAQQVPALSKETLPHHLIVSADGATEESYGSYRHGGKLAKVKAFTGAIKTWKMANQSSLPFVELQFLINRQNEGEAKATKALFDGEYDRFVTKTMQIIHPENRALFLPKEEKNNRYAKQRRTTRGCYKMLSTHTVTQDLDLALCCMDKNAEHSSGNLKRNTLKSTLENAKNRELRTRLINYEKDIDICRNCVFR